MTLQPLGRPQPADGPSTEACSDLPRYMEEMAAAFERACQVEGCSSHQVVMAGVRFRLRFAGAVLPPAILPALAHLVGGDGPAGTQLPHISFDVWESSCGDYAPPRPPFTASDYRQFRRRAVASSGSTMVMHAPGSGHICAYDRDTQRGLWWFSDASAISIYERAEPLQTLFHWALAEFGWHIIHAAAVGTGQGGVLLIGNPGAGKSTTALGCLLHRKMRLLSDDKCLTRLEPSPQASAAFCSGKISADMASRLSPLTEKVAGWDFEIKLGKGLVLLYPEWADHLVTGFPLRALVAPRVTGSSTASVAPMTPGEAFRVFGPSTLYCLPGAAADSFRFTAELTRRLPCYRLNLALDTERNCDAIHGLLAGL